MGKLMDFNKLKNFVVVADEGSITVAAKKLFRSQSAISQQIQQLEEELKIKLLERKSGKIFLSTDGEEIYNFCKKYFSKIEDELSKISQSFSILEGHIRIGVLYNYSQEIDLGKIISEFRIENPLVTFSIHEGTSQDIENELIENTTNIGLSIIFKSPSLFHRKELHTSSHSLYASSSYLKKIGKIKNYKSILDKVLIDTGKDFPCLGPFFKKNSKTLFSTLKHRTPDIVVLNQDIARDIVVSGCGIAILPDFMASEHLKNGNLVRVMASSKSTKGVLEVAYRTNRDLKKYEKVFIEKLLS
jgi:DNA-binding transcriptional LysR family regulator